MIPFALTYTFGRLVKDQRQGWVVFAVDVRDLDRGAGIAIALGDGAATRSSTRPTRARVGGNMEGKEVRFGTVGVGPVRRLDDRHLDRLGQLPPTTASRRSAARCRWST